MAETTYQDWSDDHPAAPLTGTEILLVDQGTELAGTTVAAVAAVGVTPHAADSTAVHGIADTAALVVTTDGRLTNARTPTFHSASHAASGLDAVQITQVQVTDLVSALAAKQSASPVLDEVVADSTNTGRLLLGDSTGDQHRVFLGTHCLRQIELPVTDYSGGGWQNIGQVAIADDVLFDGYLGRIDATAVTPAGDELLLAVLGGDPPTEVPLTLETVGATGPNMGVQTWEWLDLSLGGGGVWTEIGTADFYAPTLNVNLPFPFAPFTVPAAQTVLEIRMKVTAKNVDATAYQAYIQHVRLRQLP